MDENSWEEIGSFKNWEDVRELQTWMADLLERHIAIEVPVLHHYNSSTIFVEKWYKHVNLPDIWRLVNPDYPFAGVFKKVNFSDPTR